MFSSRSTLSAALVFATVVVVAGCTPVGGDPLATTTTRPSQGAPATDAPVAPELIPDGDAQDNLAYFDAVMADLLDASATPDGRTIVDHLVGAGFDKTAMEITADTTAVGGPVDAIVVAVRFDDSCIIGQTGNVGYHSLVAPLLETGRCLVGLTRAIDW